jgi:hypothetical protein
MFLDGRRRAVSPNESGVRTMKVGWAVAAVAIFGACGLGACGDPGQNGSAVALAAVDAAASGGGSSAGAEPDQELALDTTPSATPAGAVSVPLEIDRGTFLGLGTGARLADALPMLGVTPVLEHAGGAGACSTDEGDRWVMRAGGLTLAFEGTTARTAQLVDWEYVGGPAIGFTEMVAPEGVTIGATRQDALAAYDHATDLGSAIEVGDPVYLRFTLHGDTIVSIGSPCGSGEP